MLLPTKKQRFKTKVKEGQDPTYDETFTFSKVTPGTEGNDDKCCLDLYLSFCYMCQTFMSKQQSSSYMLQLKCLLLKVG